MPGMRCSIFICNNNYFDAKRKHLDITFHSFPKDAKLAAVWANKCGRADKFSTSVSYICSEHFLADDYERDLQAELLKIPAKKILKKGAVPSKRIKLNESTVTVEHSDRALVEARKKLVEEILAASTSPSCATEVSLDDPVIARETFEEKYKKLFKDHKELKKKYLDLSNNNKNLQKQVTELQTDVSAAFRDTKMERSMRLSLQNMLSSTFSKAQLDFLAKRKQRVRWSAEDISNAFVIRYLSKPCYMYLRNKLNYPLPHVSVLQKWIRKSKIEGKLKKMT